MLGVREELTKLVNKEKSPNNPSVAVKSEEEKLTRVNTRQMQTLFVEMKSQREQATSWDSLRSHLTNTSMRNPLTSPKVKNDARSNIFILNMIIINDRQFSKTKSPKTCSIQAVLYVYKSIL
jgi:hypothetical protein